MIGDIRNFLQTRAARIFLWILVGSFFIGIIPLAFRMGRNREDSLGTVNGQHIGALEFRRKLVEVQNMMKDIRQAYGIQADMVLKMWGFDKRPDDLVLDGLVGEKIMKAATDSLGARVSNDYLQAKLRDPYFVRQYLGSVIPAQAMSGGSIDTAALEYNLERQGISHEEFDEMLNDALLRAFLFKLIEGGLYIPDDALQDAYIGQFLKKKYAYLTLPLARYLAKAKETKLTQTNVQDYYSKSPHQESFRIPEKRSAKVWAFSPEAFGVVVTDKELDAAYQRGKRSYIKTPATVNVQHILLPFTEANKIEMRAKAQVIYNEVTAKPDSFADAATKHSQSKDKGTTLTLKRTDKNAPFTKAAFALQKGGISPVTETDEGFEIIKLLDRKEPEYKSLEDVKGELSKKLKEEKFGQVFNANAQRVVSQSREEPTILTNFIERHKGQETTLANEARSEKLLNSRLFNLRKNGEKAFFEEAGKGYIIELTGSTPSAIPPLESVKDKIEETLYGERALALLKKDLHQGLAEIRDKKATLEQVAQSLNGKVETTDWVSFSDQESFKKLQQLKIKLPDLVGLTTKDAVMSDITDKDGFLIQVKEVDPFKAKEFEEKKSVIRFQLRRQELQGLSGAFVQALRDKATISLNKEMLRAVKG